MIAAIKILGKIVLSERIIRLGLKLWTDYTKNKIDDGIYRIYTSYKDGNYEATVRHLEDTIHAIQEEVNKRGNEHSKG